MNQDERFTALFGGLVTMFQTAALQQMGKVQNPVTQKIERDLEQAQMSIDMLEMLKTKTAGNLKKEEDEYLNGVLRDLRLNFVDEQKKAPANPKDNP